MAEVAFSGPFFEVIGDQIMADGVVTARHAVADRGVELSRGAFDQHIRVNHGVHTSTITTTDETVTYSSPGNNKTYTMDIAVPDRNTTVVTTKNAKYGPWLSGTGSRNATTSFKGYPAFGEAADQLDDQAPAVVEDALAPYIDKLNG
jgi:hypothetical protein